MSGGFRPVLDFTSSPTLSEFILDESFVRVVWGPTGSGKSTVCCAAIMGNAMEQMVDKNNWRRSRYVIVRNTNPMLKSTTIKTWLARFPEKHCGPVRWASPITQRIIVPPRDGKPGFDCEIVFLALDTIEDIAKLRSLDVTGAWFNEASEIPPALIVFMTRRVGRFPERVGDYQAVRPFIVCDSNATDQDNPLVLFEKEQPSRWRFFRQPPAVLEVDGGGRCIEANPRFAGQQYPAAQVQRGAGRLWVVNPAAENLRWLRTGYYEDAIGGSRLAEIERDLQVKFVYVQDGKPVIPEYADELMSFDSLPVLSGIPLEIGADIGGGTLNPAAVIGQRHPSGTWLIHDELVCGDMGLKTFSSLLRAKLAEAHLKVRGVEIGRLWGDPAGVKRDELFETVIFDHLRAEGFNALPAPSNDPRARIEAVRTPMGRFIDKKPGMRIHKRCRVLRDALGGKWKYRRLQVANTERFTDVPDKSHPWSDVGDALGYLCLSGGEDRELRGRGGQAKRAAGTTAARIEFDIFG